MFSDALKQDLKFLKITYTDPRLLLINKNNEGAGISRNYGRNKSKGDMLLSLMQMIFGINQN